MKSKVFFVLIFKILFKSAENLFAYSNELLMHLVIHPSFPCFYIPDVIHFAFLLISGKSISKIQRMSLIVRQKFSFKIIILTYSTPTHN